MTAKSKKLTASDIYGFFQPEKCCIRIYLREKGVKESPPSPFDEVIKMLGVRHEKEHLKTFPSVVDVSMGTLEERENHTLEEVEKGTPVIYQGLLKAPTTLDGIDCEVVGSPDFLIFDAGRYIVRDSKVSRRITEKDHPEILLQLQTYGWLYEQTFSRPPGALQVHSGSGEIVEIPYDGGAAAIATLREILEIKRAPSEPYSPVGWTKCSGCGFSYICWKQAEERRDVAIVEGVDQGLASALRDEGIQTIDEFLSVFSAGSLSEFQRPYGRRYQRVGKKADSIMRMAQAMANGEEYLFDTPQIPDRKNFVMFDLEGLPPLDALDKIYLFGLQVFGEKPGEFLAATAGFGTDGDRAGWEKFLTNAQKVFDEYGDIPFVHWHSYEKTHLNMYVERFGDRCGVAARVRENLLDLLPVAKNSIALPLPSYSLKVVEKYIGFKRSQDEYGGDWAIAKYIEATETEDEELRDRIMDDILRYNKEDLEATWAVLQWLKGKAE